MNAQIEKSEFRRETQHRMTRRCEGWDYCARAIYMITLVQEDRRRRRGGDQLPRRDLRRDRLARARGGLFSFYA